MRGYMQAFLVGHGVVVMVNKLSAIFEGRW